MTSRPIRWRGRAGLRHEAELSCFSTPAAADFYQFTKTLETYQKTLGKETTAILTTDNDLFRLFKTIEPPKTGN